VDRRLLDLFLRLRVADFGDAGRLGKDLAGAADGAVKPRGRVGPRMPENSPDLLLVIPAAAFADGDGSGAGAAAGAAGAAAAGAAAAGAAAARPQAVSCAFVALADAAVAFFNSFASLGSIGFAMEASDAS